VQAERPNFANRIQLDLELLFSDLPIMTEWLAGEYYSALLVCLEHHNHKSGIEALLQNLDETLARLELVWSKPLDEYDRRSWGGPGNAAETAGEGIAWLIVHLFTDYAVIERSARGSGVDFWLGDKGDVDKLIFQTKARMEAKARTHIQYDSGIREVLKKALEQTEKSDHTDLPAYIVVTEFSRPVIYLVQK